MLYLDPEFGERVRTIFPTYFSFEDTSLGLEGGFKASASRFDLPLPREAVALSAGALEVLEAEGLDAILARAADLTDVFAAKLAEAGLHGRAPRPHDARLVRGRGSRGQARAAARARRRGPQPPGHAVPARVGRRLERRVRPGPAAGRAAVNAVCVYCGSSFGAKPAYAEATKQLAIAPGRARLRVVYGGASAGLMGLLADTALEHGGEVVGVIPRVLVDREVAHRGLTELHVVASMHERKAKMAELSDGFVALPGGIGTLEELIEVYTWSYLGIHDKPLGLVNTDGYYDGLAAFLDHSVSEGFLRPQTRASLRVAPDARGAAGRPGPRPDVTRQ